MSIIVIHTYQLSLLCPHIRILGIPIHFSSPAPKFKNLEKFAKYFTQPKLELYFIFGKRFVGRAYCLGKKVKNNSTSGNFDRSYISVTCFEARQGCHCVWKGQVSLRLLYNLGVWSRVIGFPTVGRGKTQPHLGPAGIRQDGLRPNYNISCV